MLKIFHLLVVTAILVVDVAGCGYRLTRVVRQNSHTPNGIVALQTEPCQLMKQAPALSVTNLVFTGQDFIVAISAQSGENLLYQVGVDSPSALCSRLPQPAGRMTGGSKGSITILNRWAGQAVVEEGSQRKVIYLVSPTQMVQSLLHEAPAQFAMRAKDQLYVVHGPGQISVEVTSISHPDWRSIRPILDASCVLPVSVFNADTVAYDDSEQTFVALLECGTSKSLAKSKDFANWKTVLDLSSILPQGAQSISATTASSGCVLLKWREQSGTWLSMATCPASPPGPLLSRGHSRDVIGIWSGKPVAASPENGSVRLWAYNQSSAQWEAVGNPVGSDCASYRAASGPSENAAVVCWNLSPVDSPTRTRIAEGFRTKDGGKTWTEF